MPPFCVSPQNHNPASRRYALIRIRKQLRKTLRADHPSEKRGHQCLLYSVFSKTPSMLLFDLKSGCSGFGVHAGFQSHRLHRIFGNPLDILIRPAPRHTTFPGSSSGWKKALHASSRDLTHAMIPSVSRSTINDHLSSIGQTTKLGVFNNVIIRQICQISSGTVKNLQKSPKHIIVYRPMV